MDNLARRRIAVQTWFVAFAGLTLISIIGLQQFRGVVAPDPEIPSAGSILSSVALVTGILGLLALLARRRIAAIYRCAGSVPASFLFAALVLVYGVWLFFAVLGGIESSGGR